jgi:spore germination cell wall hydrolase CwlJ-like protein
VIALDAQDLLLPFSFKPRERTRAAFAAAASAALGLALGAVAVAVILSIPRPPAEPAAVRVAVPAIPPGQAAAVVASAAAQRRARDLDCLAQAVYFEARGESRDGQAAVAQVVLNRVKHPAFPNTVCGVVYQGVKGRGCQFSFTCDGRAERPREGAAWRRARRVAARALAGVVVPQIGQATHFHAARVQPGWGPGFARVAQVGLHVFYRLTPVKAAARAHAAPRTGRTDALSAEAAVDAVAVAEAAPAEAAP